MPWGELTVAFCAQVTVTSIFLILAVYSLQCLVPSWLANASCMG